MKMKTYIVTWWNGAAEVRAHDADEAKALVRSAHYGYRNAGRNAPLFAEEFRG